MQRRPSRSTALALERGVRCDHMMFRLFVCEQLHLCEAMSTLNSANLNFPLTRTIDIALRAGPPVRVKVKFTVCNAVC